MSANVNKVAAAPKAKKQKPNWGSLSDSTSRASIYHYIRKLSGVKGSNIQSRCLSAAIQSTVVGEIHRQREAQHKSTTSDVYGGLMLSVCLLGDPWIREFNHAMGWPMRPLIATLFLHQWLNTRLRPEKPNMRLAAETLLQGFNHGGVRAEWWMDQLDIRKIRKLAKRLFRTFVDDLITRRIVDAADLKAKHINTLRSVSRHIKISWLVGRKPFGGDKADAQAIAVICGIDDCRVNSDVLLDRLSHFLTKELLLICTTYIGCDVIA